MPFYLRQRASLGAGARVNLSKSGASVSARAGRITLNSRGRLSVRILPGLSYRVGGSRRRGGLFG